jgi:hypothetical protein
VAEDHFRDDDVDTAEGAALSLEPAPDLLVFCRSPRGLEDDQVIRDPLQPVETGADRLRADQDVHPSGQEGLKAALVFAGVDADRVAHSLEVAADRPDHAFDVVGVDHRAGPEVGLDGLELRSDDRLLHALDTPRGVHA